jgi:non-ribosomal peptide synthetase-like protein
VTALLGREDAHGADGEPGAVGGTVEDPPREPGTALEQEIAAVLAGVLKVESVPVDAHFFDDLGADSMVMAQFCARVRKRDDLPSVAIKDVYQHPTVRELAGRLAPAAAPAVGTRMAEVLAGVLKVESVPVDAHFFDDLGADSMVMAQFCARVRKRDDLPTVAIKDVYGHPTIARLATALEVPAPAAAAPAVPPPAEPAHTATRFAYVACGIAQLLLICAYALVLAIAFQLSFDWIFAGGSLVHTYVRALLAGGATFLAACLFPIALKWVLIGRWKRQEIRVWSPAYLRFWLVKTVITINPIVVFAGSPIYSLYLRAMGAKVGRNVLVLTRHPPVCTDLVTLGDNAIIRNHTFFTGYRARGGLIQTGAVAVGRDAFVGEKSVLDIEVSIGDGAQLGHSSSLHAGQSVPAGERWHGSPGQPTDSDYQPVGPAPAGMVRAFTFTSLQMMVWFLLYVPFTTGGLAFLFEEVPALAAVLDGGLLALTGGSFFLVALVTSAVLFVVGVVLSGLGSVTVPRLLNLWLEPDTVYPLYSLRYSAYRVITRMTNRRFFVELFGDSSFVVHYLSWIGYRLKPVVQTGSNFGSELVHEHPFLCAAGSGTVVASGLHYVNSDYSSTGFRLSMTRIGANNFLGNDIVYPPQGRTGDDCLLATKVLVPIDGPIREGVGLLGSPSFEIPRTVDRDNQYIQMAHDEQFPRRLAAKNRHNLATMGYWLLAKYVYAFALTLFGLLAADLYTDLGALALAAGEVLAVTYTLVHVVLVERLSTGFRGVQPAYCSIYEKTFWQRERFFKMQAGPGLHSIFVSTPFQSWFWRMVGVRVGKRLFDDGGGMSEKNLVTLGDDVTLNAGSFLQCHSQEDYAFKSEPIAIGSGSTIGIGATVHYGVTMGDGTVLAPESFLMKGEEVPASERWGGNPAQEIPDVWVHPARPRALDTRENSSDDDGPDLRIGDGPHSPVGLHPAAHGRHRAGRRQPTGVSGLAVMNGGDA